MSKIKRWTVSLPNPDGYDIKPFDDTFHTPREIVLATDHDAEIERLRTALVADDEGRVAYQNGFHARDAEVESLRNELAREKLEHDIARTFHDIAIKERNYERVLAMKRDDEIERLRKLLRPFAALPVQELGQCQRHPDHPVFAINGVSFNTTDVLQAREALGE